MSHHMCAAKHRNLLTLRRCSLSEARVGIAELHKLIRQMEDIRQDAAEQGLR
jgi:hypothetical protein